MWNVERMRRTEMEAWYGNGIVQTQQKGTEKNRIMRKNSTEGRKTGGNRWRRTETDRECSRRNSM